MFQQKYAVKNHSNAIISGYLIYALIINFFTEIDSLSVSKSFKTDVK